MPSKGDGPPELAWLTCTVDGCAGVLIEGTKYCLAHADADVRQAFVTTLQPGAALDLRGVPLEEDLLRAVLAAMYGKYGRPSLGDAHFDKAQFSGIASFSGAQYDDVATFEFARFGGTITFQGAQFGANASFQGAQFGANASFQGAQFKGILSFRKAQFRATATFNTTRFRKSTYFGGAQFNRLVSLQRAQFRADAWFSGARFKRSAWFNGVEFTGDTWFDGAEFGGIRLNGARFNRDARFDGAQFERPGTIGPMMTHSRLVLDRAVFADAMRIDVVGGHLSCDGTRFLGATTVRLRFTAITLDGATFSTPSIIAFAENAFREQRRSKEAETFDEGPLQGVGLEARPRLYSLRGVDSSNLSLSGVDLRACRFTDAYHLDQLRIQGPRPSPKPHEAGSWAVSAAKVYQCGAGLNGRRWRKSTAGMLNYHCQPARLAGRIQSGLVGTHHTAKCPYGWNRPASGCGSRSLPRIVWPCCIVRYGKAERTPRMSLGRLTFTTVRWRCGAMPLLAGAWNGFY